MDLLEIACPTCEKILAMDSGFAGGVCRCSNCGTLMTVPEDPSNQLPEALARPDQPGMPSHSSTRRPATVGGQRSRHQPRNSLDPSLPSTKHRPESSSSVRISPKVQLATDQAKGKQRLLIFVSVLSIAVLVVGIIVVGIMALVQYEAKVARKRQERPAISVEFEYNPKANPFLMNQPNVLGLMLSQRTVVVIDASKASRRWLGLIKDAIRIGSNFDTQTIALQIVCATSEEELTYPDRATPLIRLQHEEMTTFLNGILSFGTTQIVEGLKHGLTLNPRHLVLITGQEPTTDQIKSIWSLLKKSSLERLILLRLIWRRPS